MNKDYLTIKEYAEIKGISTQAVYKQLSTKLSTFVEVVDNKKMLKIEVLEGEVANKVDNNSTKVAHQVDNPSALSDEEEFKRINRRNEDIIDELRAQLKEKDEQLQKQSDQIVDLSNKIAELFENNQKLQLNYQLLLGSGTEQEIINVDEEGTKTEEIIQEEPKKKGFFKRLFNID